jgi:CRISPR-associated protein Cmr4
MIAVADQRKTAGGLLGLHAQTPVHPGAGTALGVVDLPIQRERHTHWPNAAGSSLKGILRDACRDRIAGNPDLDSLDRHDDERDEAGQVSKRVERKGRSRERADNTLLLNELFGPPTTGAAEFAGALSVTDARLAAFPVRSLKGVFAWVSCPAVLDRLARDADLAGLAGLPDYAAVTRTLDAAKRGKAFPCVTAADCPCLTGGSVVLEEFEFKKLEGDPGPIARWFAETLFPADAAYRGTRERFVKHLVVLHDDDFTHFARYATEILARIKLNYESKTVDGGALFYQEFLPAETLLYSVVLANPARGRKDIPAADLLGRLAGFLPPVLQVGGDESVGKGYCGVRLTTANGGAK